MADSQESPAAEHADASHGEGAHHAHNPFDPAHLFAHVQDATYFEIPKNRYFPDGHVPLPQPIQLSTPIFKGYGPIQPLDFKLTKFMVLEVLAALLIAGIFIWIASKVRGGKPPKGKPWNLFEAMMLFIRDQVARPAIGGHGADKFVPFLWTLFFFVLINNLLGLIPWLGSATGALATTAALAFITFCTVCIAGMFELGPFGFLKAQVPHMDLPLPLAILLKPMIFAIEILGMGIKHFVLAVRLLANMMAGHLVLAVIVGFIAASAGSAAWWGVAPASVFGAVGLSLLELFVAFLQAYIFTFLSALFIGMAVHPH
ncbi:MAG: F0F1 ATP synthase subunit A [Pirellulales bacterium]